MGKTRHGCPAQVAQMELDSRIGTVVPRRKCNRFNSVGVGRELQATDCWRRFRNARHYGLLLSVLRKARLLRNVGCLHRRGRHRSPPPPTVRSQEAGHWSLRRSSNCKRVRVCTSRGLGAGSGIRACCRFHEFQEADANR